MSNTDSIEISNTVEWNKLNWKKIQKSIFKLQKRIYKASQSGNTKLVRKLQKTQKDKFVLDADISKCFDSIDHQYLFRLGGN